MPEQSSCVTLFPNVSIAESLDKKRQTSIVAFNIIVRQPKVASKCLYKLVLLGSGVSGDSQIAERQVGGWIVALQTDWTGFDFGASARIWIAGASVFPVGHLEAIDPDGEARAVSDQGHVEPLVVVRDDPSGFCAAKDGSRAGVVFRLSSVVIGENVFDLELVAVRRCFFGAGDQAEEDSAVQSVAVCFGFELKCEV